nr:EndoU domain-containing protein [Moraxella oblonga]
MKKEQERLDENLKATGKITGAAGVQVVATTANVLTGNQTLTQAIQGAKAPAKMAKAIQDNPELAAILDAYQKGEYHNLTLSQEALQALSDATGISTKVLLTSITAQRGIQGATNKTLTVIDTHDELRADSIQTLGHELDHIRGGKNETLADLAGLAAKLNTDAAIIANQDNINPIKAQLGDGKDAQTTLQNQALLEGNDKTFVENHDGREGEWSYDHDRLLPDGSYGHPGDRVTFTNEEALIIKDLIGAVVVPIGFADAYYNAKTDEEKAMAIATAFKIPISRARIYAQQAKQHSRSKSQNIGVNNSSYSSDFHKSISGRQTDYIINQQASKRVHLVTAPIDFDGHILSAEIKRNGTVVGGHSTANGNIRVDSVVKTYSNGVYEAKISVKDPNNPNNYLPKSNNNGISTMFPNSWSADRVKVEVDYAYQNRKVVTNSRGQQMWEGITPSGVKVTGYLQPKVTVYPVK